MTKTLRIGKGLSLPLDAVTRRIGILGVSGSGKTTTARKLIEELLGHGLPVRVLDPKGDFWGLRASADGKKPGYPITILGGEHADAPLEETAGKIIGEMSLDEAPQLVIDISLFTKGAMRRFATDFLETFYHRNREAVHLVVDEADLFAPQRIPKGDQLRLFGAMDDVVRRGRKRGIGVTMICQRSADINKDILTQCNLLVAHRAEHNLDQAPVTAWMRAARMPDDKLQKVDETIAKLDDGEAWVMSPQWLKRFDRVRIALPWTFDSGATPEAGKSVREPRALAPVDLEALSARMKETIERAKENDPRALKARVAELQAQVKKIEAAKVPAAKMQIREVYVLKEGQLKRLEALFERGQKLGSDIAAGCAELAKVVAPAVRPPPPPAVAPALPTYRRSTPPPPPKGFTPPTRPAAPQRAHFDDAPPDGERPLRPSTVRVLETIAAADGLTRNQVGVRAGYRPDAGSFGNQLYDLHGRGLIEKRDDRWFATDAGRAAVPDARKLTGPELQEKWRRDLRPAEWAILDQLLNAYPNTLTRAQLAEILGKRGDAGSFGNNIYKLTGGALAEKVGSGYRAAQDFFEGSQ